MRTVFGIGRPPAGAPDAAAASRWLALCVAAALAASLSLSAATPTFWTVATQSDFLKGEVEDLSIDSDGRVFLGPTAKVIAETAAPFLWSVVAGPDGTLWAGSGNEGKVLKVAKDGKVTTFFDAPELEVHAIASAPNGGIYAATSPDGKIYSVAADGTSRTLFDPEDKYIWALAVSRDGNLFAATGDKGVIYRITPEGKGTRFYKTNTTNVVSLAFARDGSLIAGSESPGRVFRIDASGKAFVLLDSPYREIHSLRVHEDGTIYAAAVSAAQGAGGEERPSERPSGDPSRPPVPSVSTEITAISVMESPVSGSAAAPSTRAARKPGRGAIYRIRADGLWDTLWETGDDAPYDLIVEADGSLLVGTGTEGKIFRVAGNPARATLLARAAARQVTALLRDPSGRTVGATSNPGKLFALSAAPARRGTYESDVRDAGTVASWGAIRWRATGRAGQVQVFTRSGNTANPDETWSAWSRAYTQADGEQIASPNARYLQWRAVLSAESSSTSSAQTPSTLRESQDRPEPGKGPTNSAPPPSASSGSAPATGSGQSPSTSTGQAGQPLAVAGPILTSVTAAYLPRNLRPEVSAITVHPPGTVFQRPFSTGEMEIAGFEDNTSDGRQPAQTASPPAGPSGAAASAPALGRRVYQKGLQTFVWKAEDQNEDRLQFDVSYRREGEIGWKVLKRAIWDPIFVWDTTSVPDGTYLLKITASDAPSNSPGAALVGELESVSFDVDNTAPKVDVQPAARTGSRTTIAFVVRDDQSPVQRVEYSLDASRWRLAYPKDGIPDSRREEFEVSLDESEGARSVIIRVTDAMNNVATAVAEVVKR